MSFMVEIVVGINLIRSGLCGEDSGEIYFIIFKLIKFIFKLLGLGKKKIYIYIYIMEMTWLLRWLNVNIAILNVTLQLLVILVVDPRDVREKFLFTMMKNTISILRTQMVKLKAVHS